MKFTLRNPKDPGRQLQLEGFVDPELETVKVYRSADQGFQRAAELSREGNDTLSTPLLPDLRIHLALLFE